jgi:hypothetical protein
MALVSDSPFSVTVMENVLLQEANSGRFELFANAIVSAMEGGAPVLSTSYNYDQTRDGKAGGRASGIYVCTSITGDVDGKIILDLENIIKKTKIDRLYFCLSHPITEYSGDKMALQIVELVGVDFPVVMLSGPQLAEYGCSKPEICERFYSAEINDILKVINASPDENAQIRGLRLALISTTGEDSETIRQGVYNAAILDAFSTHSTLTVATCANAIAQSLAIHRPIAHQTVGRRMNALADIGLLARMDGVYSITADGRVNVTQRKGEAVGRLVALKSAIRKELEEAVETPILDEEFNRIWTVLEESMASYFTTRGEEIVSEIGQLIGGEVELSNDDDDKHNGLSFIGELAKVVAAAATGIERRPIIETAIRDIFSDRMGPAANWMVQIAAAFVAACAIGLEDKSAQAIERLLSKTVLVLDTDVLLSLVGKDEADHDGVNAIVERWKQLPGKILVGEPVLEEFARHAYIAQAEFEHVRHLLPGTEEERTRLMKNVLVRSFGRLIEDGGAKVREWPSYIDMYRGTIQYDYSKALALLRVDLKIDMLPRPIKDADDLEKKVRRFLIDRIDETWGPKLYAHDKAKRDARLYAALVYYTRARREIDPLANCILVSSARRLASAEDEFHEVGDTHIVASIASMLYLVSLLPGVSLGLSAMKAFLFEGNRAGLSGDLERTVLRVIQSSKERKLKFKQRGALMSELRELLLKDAHDMGRRGPDEVLLQSAEREALATPEKQNRLMDLLAAALDKIGPSHRVAKENEELKRKQKALEEENAKLRKKR